MGGGVEASVGGCTHCCAYLGYDFSHPLVAVETAESGSPALSQVQRAEGGAVGQRPQVQRTATAGHTHIHHLQGVGAVEGCSLLPW